MAITLRGTKGSPLTHAELDANFTTLQTADFDSADITNIIDATYINTTLGSAGYLDSSTVSTVVDSSYVSARVSSGTVDNAVSNFLGGNLNTSIIPNTTLSYSLGDSNYRFTDVWLAGSTLHLGNTSLSTTDGGVVVEDRYIIDTTNVPSASPALGNPDTFINPSWDSNNPTRLRQFGDEIVFTDTHILVGSPVADVYDSDADSVGSQVGYAWLLDSTNSVIWEGSLPQEGGEGIYQANFGRGLALSDSFAYIGAPGIAKVYQLDLSDPYNTQDSFGEPDAGQLDLSPNGSRFGYSMAHNGTYLMIGAWGWDANVGDSNQVSNVGRVYGYINDSISGDPFITLTNPNGDSEANQWFGFDVDISDEALPKIIVGAYQGRKAYTFQIRSIDNYWQQQNMTQDSMDPGSIQGFGRSVAIAPNGQKIVVTSEKTQNIAYDGEAYIYDSLQTLQYTLTPPNVIASQGLRFGNEMSMNNNYTVITATGYPASVSNPQLSWGGQAYVYDLSDGSLLTTIQNPNSFGDSSEGQYYYAGDWFGKGVDLRSDGALVISAILEDYNDSHGNTDFSSRNDSANQNSGVFYRWDVSGVPVDSNLFNGIFDAKWTNDSGLVVELDPRYGKELQDLKALNLNDVITSATSTGYKLYETKVDGNFTQSAEDADGHVTLSIPLTTDNPNASPRYYFRYQSISYDGSSSNLNINSTVSDPIDIEVGAQKYLYVLNSTSNSPQNIYRWTMATEDSGSTGVLDAGSLSISTGNVVSFQVDVDGRYLFALDDTTRTIQRYNMSTKFDLTTATIDNAAVSSALTEASTPTSFTFNLIGTRMYLAGGTDKTIYQYDLSTPWDPSTITYSDKKKDVSLSSAALSKVGHIRINPSDYQMYIGNDINKLYVGYFSSSGRGDITTLGIPNNSWTYFGTGGFDLPRDGTKIYTHSTSGVRYITQYSTDDPNYNVSGNLTTLANFYGKKIPVTSLAQIPFVADDPNDWDTVPKSVDDAVNRMSNLIKTLNSGNPIP